MSVTCEQMKHLSLLMQYLNVYQYRSQTGACFIIYECMFPWVGIHLYKLLDRRGSKGSRWSGPPRHHWIFLKYEIQRTRFQYVLHWFWMCISIFLRMSVIIRAPQNAGALYWSVRPAVRVFRAVRPSGYKEIVKSILQYVLELHLPNLH